MQLPWNKVKITRDNRKKDVKATSSDVSSSNAFNYKTINSTVNPRTGSLSVKINAPALSGPLGELVTPSIFYVQNQTTDVNLSVLGLPSGWSYGFSFVHGGKVFVHGQQSYAPDLSTTSTSGLRYYTLNNMVYSTKGGEWRGHAYGGNLSFLTGETEYFDTHGRLLGIEDKYGNYAVFSYLWEDDVYNSKLDKIATYTGGYQQVIVFKNSDDKVEIAYDDSVVFSYLKDSEGKISGYITPLGDKVQIITLSLPGSRLIDQICYPNNLIIKYEYDNLNYSTDDGIGSIQCVSRVTSTYQDKEQPINNQSRITIYDYNPNNDWHNFTGYNVYSFAESQDSLLTNDSLFTYSTQIDDGINITKHTYNHRHLEIKTETYARKSDGSKSFMTSDTKYTYPGENESSWSILISKYPNYQTPEKIETTIYDDNGESITHTTETTFDNYGNAIDVKKYQTDILSGNAILISHETTIFDYDNYGLTIQKDVYDYGNYKDANFSPIVRREINTLADEDEKKKKRSIATITNGFLKNGIFERNQMTSFKYDSVGRVIYQKLEWNDGQDHRDLSYTQTETQYSIDYSPENKPLMNITYINEQGNKRIRQINAITGWILKDVDPLGRITSYSYDTLGRKLSATNPVGQTKKWIYDDKQNKITEQYSNGYEKYYYYNGFGQPIKVADNIGNEGVERILKQRTYYSETGQLYTEEGILGEKSRITYGYDNRGNIATKTDALDNIVSYEYNQAKQNVITKFNGIDTNKLQSHVNTKTKEIYSAATPTISVKSASTVNAYNKVITQQLGIEEDSNARITTTYDYDVNLDVVNACTIGQDSVKMQANVVRDLFGNSTKNTVKLTTGSLQSVEANSSEYFYNTLNQLTKELSVLGQTLNEYDSAGQQIKHTDYAGTVFTSSYDKDGRISTSVYQDKAGKKHFREYTYDQNRQLISLKETVDGTSQTLSYSYTALENQLAAITYPDGKSVKYFYDRFSRPWQFIDVMGQVTQYSYDDFGRLSNLEILHTDYSASIVYYSKDEDKANSGKVKNITFNNKVQKKYVYNGFGLIDTSIVIDTAAPQEANIINKIVYTYDSVTHNIIKMDYSSNIDSNNKDLNYTVEYTYNSLNQLIIEKTSDTAGKLLSSTNYTHDAASNIILEEVYDAAGVMTRISYIYDADNKLLSTQKQVGQGPTTTIQFKYDKNGNLIDDGQGAIFIYNEVNQLVEYKNQNITAVYTYYPDGLRASKKVNDSNAIQFYYDGSAVALLVNEIQGDKSTSYFMHGSERYIRLVKGNDNTSVHYALTNGKDTIGLLGNNKNFEKVYKYSPYGEEKNRSLIGVSDINENPFLYASEYVDAESGLIYLRARYYNPGIKRFMSRDVTKLFNRYIYASANPIMNVDPTGHISWLNIGLDIAAIAASVAAVVAAPFSGGSSLAIGAAVVGGVLGAASGATGIAAEATNNKNLSTASMVTGIMSAAVGLGEIGASIANGVRSGISASRISKAGAGAFTFGGEGETVQRVAYKTAKLYHTVPTSKGTMFLNFAEGFKESRIEELAQFENWRPSNFGEFYPVDTEPHVVSIHAVKRPGKPLMIRSDGTSSGDHYVDMQEFANQVNEHLPDDKPVRFISCFNNSDRALCFAKCLRRDVLISNNFDAKQEGREFVNFIAHPDGTYKEIPVDHAEEIAGF